MGRLILFSALCALIWHGLNGMVVHQLLTSTSWRQAVWPYSAPGGGWLLRQMGIALGATMVLGLLAVIATTGTERDTRRRAIVRGVVYSTPVLMVLAGLCDIVVVVASGVADRAALDSMEETVAGMILALFASSIAFAFAVLVVMCIWWCLFMTRVWEPEEVPAGTELG